MARGRWRHTDYLGQLSKSLEAEAITSRKERKEGEDDVPSGQIAPQPRLTQEPQGTFLSQRSLRLRKDDERMRARYGGDRPSAFCT